MGRGDDISWRAPGPGTPWYRAHPCRALVLATALFAGVSVLAWFVEESGQAIAVLYVLPIALVAVTFGLRGGLLAATGGFVLFSLFALTHATGDIDATGWIVRAIAMFLLGGLLGRATDQSEASQRAALAEQRRRARAEEANHRFAEALEVNDTIVQQMVAAKWMVERGQHDQALDLLSDTIEQGERVVADILPTRVVRRPAAHERRPVTLHR